MSEWSGLRSAVIVALALTTSSPVMASERRKDDRIPAFTVDDHLSLSEISVLLYGTTRRWKELAETNSLQAPYPVHLGQRLKLKTPPSISLEEGRDRLLKMWRTRFGLHDEPVAPAQPDFQTLSESPAESQRVNQRFEEEQKLATAAAPEKSVELDAEAALREGQSALQHGLLPEARDLLERARTLDPASVEAWIAEMRALELLRKNDEARSIARDFAARFPDLAELPLVKRLNPDGSR